MYSRLHDIVATLYCISVHASPPRFDLDFRLLQRFSLTSLPQFDSKP